jgi:AcrR family transcriptional regulator
VKSREYESPTRKAQAEETRRKILRSLVELLMEERPATISIPQVARRAGVSVRIVYHYFPTKEALFDAVIDEVNEMVTFPDDYVDMRPTSPAELVASLPGGFKFLERNRAVFRAVSMSELRERLEQRRLEQRIGRVDIALAPLSGRLDAVELRKLRAIVGVLTAFDGYDALTTTWGLSTDEAAEAVAWAVRTLTDRARRSGVAQ